MFQPFAVRIQAVMIKRYFIILYRYDKSNDYCFIPIKYCFTAFPLQNIVALLAHSLRNASCFVTSLASLFLPFAVPGICSLKEGAFKASPCQGRCPVGTEG